MKDQKYRAFMVTPAFIKARERKERNDVSYGRVFPHLESNTLGNVDHRSIGKGLDERNTVISPRSIKVCSAPAPRTKGLNSVVDGHPGEPRLDGGNHFLSWKIPDRILSTGNIQGTGIVPKESGHLPNEVAKANQVKMRETSTGTREKPKEATASPPDLPRLPSSIRKGNHKSSKKETEKDPHDFAKEWLSRYDKEERHMAEELLNSPSDNILAANAFKPAIAFTKQRPATDGSVLSFSAKQSAVSRLSCRTNILHRTSSVAWRRDSAWLKPTKISYQSWHGLPRYSMNADVNITSMYMLPHKKQGTCFIIHPEWSSRV
ncbi:uncharacterized protein LOC135693252 [Rhopilema esculentum]|uniref:uncharacterized protein LOC135693252 n=1 Tax=Rhopilema esculentum TaxID=499914 RepID=UPI0031E26AA3